MAHRVAPEAEAELDNIWYYVAKDSGSIEIADRLIDSISARFYLLAVIRTSDAAVTRICALACGAFPWASTSSSTDSKGRTC
jgi:hypothetical protein